MEINLTKVSDLPRVYFENNNYYIILKMGTLLKKYTNEEDNQFFYIANNSIVRDNSIVEVIYDQKFVLDHSFKNDTKDETKFNGIYFTNLQILKYFHN